MRRTNKRGSTVVRQRWLLLLSLLALAGCSTSRSLHEAARHGDISGIERFLKSGSNINEQDKFSGWTAVQVAASEGKADAVRYLIKKAADINLPSKDGFTPLHEAVMYRRQDVVRILLDAGARVDIQTSAGATALDFARTFATPAIQEMIRQRVAGSK
jgi:ankyrin repeat protein